MFVTVKPLERSATEKAAQCIATCDPRAVSYTSRVDTNHYKILGSKWG